MGIILSGKKSGIDIENKKIYSDAENIAKTSYLTIKGISLKYENGDTLSIYHFGNMFIRSEKGSWYKMTYDEASRFDALLDKLK